MAKKKSALIKHEINEILKNFLNLIYLETKENKSFAYAKKESYTRVFGDEYSKLFLVEQNIEKDESGMYEKKCFVFTDFEDASKYYNRIKETKRIGTSGQMFPSLPQPA